MGILVRKKQKRQNMERAAKKRYIVKVNHEQNFKLINVELQLIAVSLNYVSMS